MNKKSTYHTSGYTLHIPGHCTEGQIEKYPGHHASKQHPYPPCLHNPAHSFHCLSHDVPLSSLYRKNFQLFEIVA
jgi:hypothetical protein